MSKEDKWLQKVDINTTDKWIVFIKHCPADVGFNMYGPFPSLAAATEFVEDQEWEGESFIAEIHRRSKMELVKQFNHHDMVE